MANHNNGNKMLEAGLERHIWKAFQETKKQFVDRIRNQFISIVGFYRPEPLDNYIRPYLINAQGAGDIFKIREQSSDFGYLNQMVNTGKAIIVNIDESDWNRDSKKICRQKGIKVKSVITIPLRIGEKNQIQGAVNIFFTSKLYSERYKYKKKFTEQLVNFCEIFSENIVNVAIQGYRNEKQAQFLSFLSHDVGNEIQNIHGPCQSLLFYVQDEKLRKKINNILLSVDAAVQMIRNRTHYEKISLGILKLKLREIRLDAKLKTLCKNYNERAQISKNITVDFECDKEYSVEYDWPLISIAFDNIIHNAMKYSGRNGEIMVKLTSGSDNNLKIIFQDTGSGFKTDELIELNQRINDDVELENHITSGFNSQLGLFIASKAIRMHKGKIILGNTPQGAKVTVTLPTQ